MKQHSVKVDTATHRLLLRLRGRTGVQLGDLVRDAVRAYAGQAEGAVTATGPGRITFTVPSGSGSIAGTLELEHDRGPA